MMNSEIKYSDVLKTINGTKGGQKITIIRNMTLEPVFSDYLRFYDRSINVEYIDVMTYLSSKTSGNTAVVILNLAELSPCLSDDFFSLDISTINEGAVKIEEMLNALIEKLYHEYTNVIFAAFELDYYRHIPNGVFDYNDFVQRINDYIYALAKDYKNIHIINMNKVIGMIGADHFYDTRGWYMATSPYSVLGCNALAYEVVKHINMIKGQTKKCLILDCDNVLWGGIISEDGIDNILLSRQYSGRAYRDFQRETLRLCKEGILICLCSKNNENDIWEVFDSHPDMLLKREHITAYRINWNNKADNIAEISNELNISPDNMVFIDDSEYETDLVLKTLPQVTVIHLDPKKPHTYADILKRCDLFNNIAITEEAVKRSRMYLEQAERNQQKKKYADIEEYHKSLKMETQVLFADKFSLARIAEMSQRTNQFNLSARKYTVDELEKLADSENYDMLYLKASDIFGDMGIVCAAIVCYTGNNAVIEAFMLSCRAFCRGFEKIMLASIKERIREKGIVDLYGVYCESMKNQRYKNFYQDNEVALYG